MEANGSFWDLQNDADIALDAAGDTLAAEILDVVARYPDGARARDVGNALGVDWRRVLGAARALADRGLVEQVDQDFYAIPKASR